MGIALEPPDSVRSSPKIASCTTTARFENQPSEAASPCTSSPKQLPAISSLAFFAASELDSATRVVASHSLRHHPTHAASRGCSRRGTFEWCCVLGVVQLRVGEQQLPSDNIPLRVRFRCRRECSDLLEWRIWRGEPAFICGRWCGRLIALRAVKLWSGLGRGQRQCYYLSVGGRVPGFERTAPVYHEEPKPNFGETFDSLKDVFEAIVKDEGDHVLTMKDCRGEQQ